MKDRTPSRARAVATTTLPLATAAAVATILAVAPAHAAPAQPAVPTTPAQPEATEVQGPGDQSDEQQPGTTPNQPGITTPQPGGTPPSDPNQPPPNQSAPNQSAPNQSAPNQSAPNQSAPNQSAPEQKNPPQTSPSQPGITSPRTAPLPVPGRDEQTRPPAPATVPDKPAPEELREPDGPKQAQPRVMPSPTQPAPDNQGGTGRSGGGQGDTGRSDKPGAQGNTDTPGDSGPQQEQWEAPSLQSAPAAPVVPMDGPHTEVGANIDGNGLVPGYAANTHHFNNPDGYVGTMGYSTPTGTGDAGASVEYVEANKIKVTTYTHTTGIDDLKSATGFNDVTDESYVDTTQANAAKAAVEGWIKQQPGGQAALDGAAEVGKLPEGEWSPQTASAVGVTTQWSGSVQN